MSADRDAAPDRGVVRHRRRVRFRRGHPRRPAVAGAFNSRPNAPPTCGRPTSSSRLARVVLGPELPAEAEVRPERSSPRSRPLLSRSSERGNRWSWPSTLASSSSPILVALLASSDVLLVRPASRASRPRLLGFGVLVALLPNFNVLLVCPAPRAFRPRLLGNPCSCGSALRP